MAMVDPDDDSIARWVVWHYRHDPDRRQRRNIIVVAFDNPDEFQSELDSRAGELRARRQRDEVDRSERIGGCLYEAGYHRRQRNAHLVKRAVEHGASAAIQDLGLPSNVSIARAVDSDDNPDDDEAHAT